MFPNCVFSIATCMFRLPSSDPCIMDFDVPLCGISRRLMILDGWTLGNPDQIVFGLLKSTRFLGHNHKYPLVSFVCCSSDNELLYSRVACLSSCMNQVLSPFFWHKHADKLTKNYFLRVIPTPHTTLT